MEAVSPEAREAKVVSGPKAPSASEREKHEVTHLPHQGWCEHCVRGRSREDAHRRAGVQEREVPTVSLDYCFVGKKGEEQLKVLVVHDGESKAVFAHVVNKK